MEHETLINSITACFYSLLLAGAGFLSGIFFASSVWAQLDALAPAAAINASANTPEAIQEAKFAVYMKYFDFASLQALNQESLAIENDILAAVNDPSKAAAAYFSMDEKTLGHDLNHRIGELREKVKGFVFTSFFDEQRMLYLSFSCRNRTVRNCGLSAFNFSKLLTQILLEVSVELAEYYKKNVDSGWNPFSTGFSEWTKVHSSCYNDLVGMSDDEMLARIKQMCDSGTPTDIKHYLRAMIRLELLINFSTSPIREHEGVCLVGGEQHFLDYRWAAASVHYVNKIGYVGALPERLVYADYYEEAGHRGLAVANSMFSSLELDTRCDWDQTLMSHPEKTGEFIRQRRKLESSH